MPKPGRVVGAGFSGGSTLRIVFHSVLFCPDITYRSPSRVSWKQISPFLKTPFRIHMFHYLLQSPVLLYVEMLDFWSETFPLGVCHRGGCTGRGLAVEPQRLDALVCHVNYKGGKKGRRLWAERRLCQADLEVASPGGPKAFSAFRCSSSF
ncbi:hypothetical protein BDV12DRAFT_48690 [Aspergillus spectabilis]